MKLPRWLLKLHHRLRRFRGRSSEAEKWLSRDLAQLTTLPQYSNFSVRGKDRAQEYLESMAKMVDGARPIAQMDGDHAESMKHPVLVGLKKLDGFGLRFLSVI